jgi:hypothetical protein
MLLGLLPANANSAIMLSQNHFAELNRHILSFLHSILLYMSIVLSNAGDALRHSTKTSVVF